MSRGKYSPNCPYANKGFEFFDRNALGEIPPAYDHVAGEYEERLHFADYDPDGYDSYGYSAFDSDGDFVGMGSGIDRNGYTEMDYLCMDDDEFEAVL